MTSLRKFYLIHIQKSIRILLHLRFSMLQLEIKNIHICVLLNLRSRFTDFFLLSQYEPRHDKTVEVTVRPVRTHISLGIHPVWSESTLSAWRKLGSLATYRGSYFKRYRFPIQMISQKGMWSWKIWQKTTDSSGITDLSCTSLHQQYYVSRAPFDVTFDSTLFISYSLK